MRLPQAGVIRQAMANRDLRKVLVAFFIFTVGEWATWIALLVWAYDRGGVGGASAIALVQLVPSAFFAAPAAAWISRLPGASALRAGYAAQALTSIALGAAMLLDGPVPVVAVLAAIAAVAITITRPAHSALLPLISRTTGDLTTGNAATGSVEAIGTFVGPLFSGLVLATWSAGGVPLVVGVLSLVSVVLTGRLHSAPSGGPRSAAPTEPRGSLRAVARDPAARLFCALIAAENVLVGMMDILLVVLALEILSMSDAGPGILNSAIGFGGLAGAAVTFLLVGRHRLALALTAGAVAAGVAFAFAGIAGSVPIAVVLIAMSGAGKMFFDVASRTFVQRLLPDHLLTAVFGLQESVMMAGIAVGALVAPVLVASVGAEMSFVAAGLFLPVVALAAFRRLRAFDAEAQVPADVLALLLGVPIIAVLKPRIIERLARDSVPVLAGPADVIVAEGDPGDRFFVIASGRVEVTMAGHSVRELGAGDWFGEIALLRDVPRTATVTAAEPTALWAMGRTSFLASVAAAPPAVAAAEHYAHDVYDVYDD